MGYDFEWDDAKNSSNLIKHKIDFADAVQVFFDERRILRLDTRFDYGEDRYQVHRDVLRASALRRIR